MHHPLASSVSRLTEPGRDCWLAAPHASHSRLWGRGSVCSCSVRVVLRLCGCRTQVLKYGVFRYPPGPAKGDDETEGRPKLSQGGVVEFIPRQEPQLKGNPTSMLLHESASSPHVLRAQPGTKQWHAINQETGTQNALRTCWAQRSGGPPPRSRGGPPPQRVVWPCSVKASWKLIYKCSPVCGRVRRCRVSTAVRRSCGPSGSGSPRSRGPDSVIPQAFGRQLLPRRNQACPQ